MLYKSNDNTFTQSIKKKWSSSGVACLLSRLDCICSINSINGITYIDHSTTNQTIYRSVNDSITQSINVLIHHWNSWNRWAGRCGTNQSINQSIGRSAFPSVWCCSNVSNNLSTWGSGVQCHQWCRMIWSFEPHWSSTRWSLNPIDIRSCCVDTRNGMWKRGFVLPELPTKRPFNQSTNRRDYFRHCQLFSNIEMTGEDLWSLIQVTSLV